MVKGILIELGIDSFRLSVFFILDHSFYSIEDFGNLVDILLEL